MRTLLFTIFFVGVFMQGVSMAFGLLQQLDVNEDFIGIVQRNANNAHRMIQFLQADMGEPWYREFLETSDASQARRSHNLLGHLLEDFFYWFRGTVDFLKLIRDKMVVLSLAMSSQNKVRLEMYTRNMEDALRRAQMTFGSMQSQYTHTVLVAISQKLHGVGDQELDQDEEEALEAYEQVRHRTVTPRGRRTLQWSET